MPERLPPGIGLAVSAALLFGLATPAAHLLLAGTTPLMLSALLYLGSGGGLTLLALPAWRDARWPALGRGEWLPLAAAVMLGGMLAPVCLLAGLAQAGATRTALLLNLEGVFTALLAWRLFGEAADRSVMAGMACVVGGSLLLAWPDHADAGVAAPALALQPGSWLIALACLCWGLDNNLTRHVSHLDARGIALCKGLVAGSVNLALARLHGDPWPAASLALPALATGLLGYGLSLVAYVRAQSQLGAARTAAWFGLAPFAGALAALLLPGETPPPLLWPAAVLLATGLWLHLCERHEHWHEHAPQLHDHHHRHDAHHQHAHDFAWDGSEPHAHPHLHLPLRHRHAHFPDLHHRHPHRSGIGRRAAADAGLLQAYRNTAYRLDGPDGFVMRVDQHCPALAARYAQLGCDCAAFVTACNPRSRPTDPARNAERQRQLRAELEAAGYAPLDGYGEAAQDDWPREHSLLVPGMGRDEALAVAARWEQVAIVWSGADAIPRLLFTEAPR